MEAKIVYEDSRYPMLVLSGDFGTHGYLVDSSTGALQRVCICNAKEDSECVCGYDNSADDNL